MTTSGALDPTDRALVLALAAWAGPEALPLLGRFGPARARSLARSIPRTPPVQALATLRDALRDQSRPDPARVHPSWFARALREESPSVRRAILAGLPASSRPALLRELGLAESDLAADRPADPEAVSFARGIWAERLLGDDPPGPDDRPSFLALVVPGPTGRYRIARLAGLAKLGSLPDEARHGERALTPSRLASFEARRPRSIDPRLITLGVNDWSAARGLGRHRLAGLGLTTIGRLLTGADPRRLRWALQHVPYPVAKRLRAALSAPPASVHAVRAWEAGHLDVALARLVEEGHPPLDPTAGGDLS